MEVRKEVEQHFVNGTGTVLPVPFSHLSSSVGVHWLRISFLTKKLGEVAAFLNKIWGDFDQDGYGFWSYDSRFIWKSGVSLNYDEDPERSNRVHCGMMTLDCPGSSLDEVTAPDLQLLIEFCEAIGGKCTRIDTFFDDYARRITPHEIYDVVKKGDYSGFRTYSRIERGNRNELTHDEIAFGRRGSFGNGKYLRIYDKELESHGEQKCIRYEVEWTGRKADSVFKKISVTCGNVEAFATLVGSLVAGSVTFVKRTGDKNVCRLDVYDWWREIVEILHGPIVIRTSRKKDSLTGKIEWVKRNVSPSLACLRNVFVNDKAFFRWLFDICHEGESRMNSFSEQIAHDNEHTLNYQWGKFIEIDEDVYEKAVSQL